MGHAADPQVVVEQARAAHPLEQVEYFLAVAQAPEKGRNGPHVQSVGADRQQVAGNTLQLGHEHADVFQPVRELLEPHELFHRQHVGQLLVHGAQVIHAVDVGDHLRVRHLLRVFLEAAVQVAEVRRNMLHQLPVGNDFEPQHAVRAGVLRPHLQDQVIALPLVTDAKLVPCGLSCHSAHVGFLNRDQAVAVADSLAALASFAAASASSNRRALFSSSAARCGVMLAKW